MANTTDDLISCITKKKLPLSSEQLGQVKVFCTEQINAGNFRVLGEIPDLLRRDWLDISLEDTVRACEHTNVEAAEWRATLESQCNRTVEAYLQQNQDSKKDFALLMWRAALAYAFSLDEYGIKVCHIEAKRNEQTLKVITPMPLSKNDEKAFQDDEYDKVLIPDPMLASGVSNAFAIDMLNVFGVPNKKITLMCVVAAPEGVFHLLSRYPDIKIMAVTLDGCLNKNAYIIEPGLGDAGEKYFRGNSLTNFERTRHIFNSDQWFCLSRLLKMANRSKK